MRSDKNAILTFDAVVEFMNKDANNKNISILDIGCGQGELLKELHDNGFENLIGLGYEVPSLSFVRLIDGIDLSEKNWGDRFLSEQYDYVVSTDVIEHLINPYQFLIESHKLIKPDGVLILTFPNVHNLKSILLYMVSGRFSGFFGRNFNKDHYLYDQHIFIPNLHLLKYFLNISGYRIKNVFYINGVGKFFSQTTMLTIVTKN